MTVNGAIIWISGKRCDENNLIRRSFFKKKNINNIFTIWLREEAVWSQNNKVSYDILNARSGLYLPDHMMFREIDID